MRLVKPLLTNRAFSPVTFELIVSTTHLCLSLLHATYWVNPHDGVLRLHRLSANKLSITAGVLCLVETAVFSTQALKQSLDWLRQASICCGLRCPCGIATGWRNGQEGKNGNSGWLMFVRNIGMVPGSCQSFPSLSCPIFVVWTKVDVVILEVALDMSSNGLRSRSVFALSHPHEATNMNVQRAEISRKLCLLLWSNILKVLPTEDDHTPLCNQQRKFILLRVIQLRQLKTSNLSSDHWRNFGDLEFRVGAGQQSRLGFVRCKSPVRELERLDRVKVSLFVIDGEIIVITILGTKELECVLSLKLHGDSR